MRNDRPAASQQPRSLDLGHGSRRWRGALALSRLARIRLPVVFAGRIFLVVVARRLRLELGNLCEVETVLVIGQIELVVGLFVVVPPSRVLRTGQNAGLPAPPPAPLRWKSRWKSGLRRRVPCAGFAFAARLVTARRASPTALSRSTAATRGAAGWRSCVGVVIQIEE
jgi:hypothetical protein